LGYVGELAETSNRQIALTNKLFSYLLGGVPSLATDIPSHRQLAPQLGEAMTLFPIGDAAALASAIDRHLLDPPDLAKSRAYAWHLGQTRFNWDTERARLTDIVAKVAAC
jgi:glycosyltransferase involved in cell wall biosynthesis